VTSSGRVAMEKTKLLVGGGVSPTGDPMTSAAGAPRDYGGAQQLETSTQQPDAGIIPYNPYIAEYLTGTSMQYQHCINSGTNMPTCYFRYCTHYSVTP